MRVFLARRAENVRDYENCTLPFFLFPMVRCLFSLKITKRTFQTIFFQLLFFFNRCNTRFILARRVEMSAATVQLKVTS